MLNAVGAKELKSWLEQNKVFLIDVRGADEHAREHIPGARLVPLDRLEKTDFGSDLERVAVFHCATGNRTAMAAKALLGTGFNGVYHLAGGIAAWKQAGLPVAFDAKQPLPINRQVQIAAGTMTMLGIVLAVLVSPWFALLSAFVGAGLTYAGASGTCMLANLLAQLPYNRRLAQAPA